MSSACSSVDDDDFGNLNISELVSILRTAFRSADFDKVEEELVARDVKMKRQIENKSKEFETLQKKFEFRRLDELIQVSTLGQSKEDPKEFEKWRETSEKLKEKEAEIQLLKQLVVNVNEDRMAAYEKEKIALARYEKLLEDVKNAGQDDKNAIEQLNSRISELERAKRAAELDAEHWKKKYDEVGHKSGASNDRTENLKGGGKLASKCILQDSDCDDDHASLKDFFGARANRKRSLCIDDSGEYNAKRNGEKNTTLLDKSKARDSLMKVGAMLETVQSDCPAKIGSESRFSSGTNDSKKVITPSKSAAVTLKQWESEVELLAAFEEHDELCMEAVCVLYQQSKLMGKPYSSSRGFQSHVLRGKALALFLLDDDPQGRMKKSAIEMAKFDIQGVSDCRKIAMEHSRQLFELFHN